MAIDRENVEKIIAGFVGVGVVGLGISALIESVIDGGEPFAPSYSGSRSGSAPEPEDGEDDEGYYEYVDIPTVDEVFEEDRIHREMDSMWDDHQADQMWKEYHNGEFQQRDASRDYQDAQREFTEKSNSYQTEYIYLDFTQNMKFGSYRNRNDVYQESIEDQFEKIKRKLALYGKNDITDLRKFVSLCFPMMKSTYYVSLPSFERKIEKADNYRGADCIYNMVFNY